MEITVQNPTGYAHFLPLFGYSYSKQFESGYYERHYQFVQRYTNVTNIAVRFSSGDDSKQYSLLVNSHFDSVFTSEGAGDDGAGVCTMLEMARNIMSGEPLLHSIIFLFNGAEEATPGVMPAAHGFITQHPWREK
jgi:acetylornithine deacetylase/succinyl-diaminopimelate desuccinylase-like protein